MVSYILSLSLLSSLFLKGCHSESQSSSESCTTVNGLEKCSWNHKDDTDETWGSYDSGKQQFLITKMSKLARGVYNYTLVNITCLDEKGRDLGFYGSLYGNDGVIPEYGRTSNQQVNSGNIFGDNFYSLLNGMLPRVQNNVNGLMDNVFANEQNGGLLNDQTGAYPGLVKNQAFSEPSEAQAFVGPEAAQDLASPQRAQVFNSPQRAQVFNSPQRAQVFNSPLGAQFFASPQRAQVYAGPTEGQIFTSPTQVQTFDYPIRGQSFTGPIGGQSLTNFIDQIFADPIRRNIFTGPTENEVPANPIGGQVLPSYNVDPVFPSPIESEIFLGPIGDQINTGPIGGQSLAGYVGQPLVSPTAGQEGVFPSAGLYV